MCASCNRSYWNRQRDREVIRQQNICVTRISGRIWGNTAGHNSHPAGYNTYTVGCWLSPLEGHARFTLHPVVHEEARPDVTHIRPDVMDIRSDML